MKGSSLRRRLNSCILWIEGRGSNLRPPSLAPPSDDAGPAFLPRSSHTFIGRPFTARLLRVSIAVRASSSRSISTNAKPFERLVSRSEATTTLTVAPISSKSCESCSLVTSKSRLLMKSFFLVTGEFMHTPRTLRGAEGNIRGRKSQTRHR